MQENLLTVWHVYDRYTNFGDHALGVGLRNLFRRYFHPQTIFRLYDAQTTSLGRGEVAALNASADLLLIGGGGLVRPVGRGWGVRLPDALLPALRVPVVVYGLGYERKAGQSGLAAGAVRNLQALQGTALSFSVRSDGTRQQLADLGLDAPEMPDAGFFVDGDYARPALDGRYVLVQISGDVQNSEALIAGLLPVCERLLQQGYQLLLAPHTRADLAASERLAAALRSRPEVTVWDWYQFMRDELTLAGLAYYKYADFVISMRAHAQICPIGLGVPVISLGSSAKNQGLLTRLALPALIAPAHEEGFSHRLQDLVAQVQAQRDQIAALYRARTGQMEAEAAALLAEAAGRYPATRRSLLAAGPPAARSPHQKPSGLEPGYKKGLL